MQVASTPYQRGSSSLSPAVSAGSGLRARQSPQESSDIAALAAGRSLAAEAAEAAAPGVVRAVHYTARRSGDMTVPLVAVQEAASAEPASAQTAVMDYARGLGAATYPMLPHRPVSGV